MQGGVDPTRRDEADEKLLEDPDSEATDDRPDRALEAAEGSAREVQADPKVVEAYLGSPVADEEMTHA